ncbi:hypothetical protein Pcinc_007183 [Petrolisthes cinctipes]|uniref:Uncharacterized protein n=1 Tax=Petrolisthes cinctipes TaxID=88211 RepID=A0AAE1GBM7_PETCI|nr:hypothetical protein Pcinc_007183 [Petrolisthes cinctipes]
MEQCDKDVADRAEVEDGCIMLEGRVRRVGECDTEFRGSDVAVGRGKTDVVERGDTGVLERDEARAVEKDETDVVEKDDADVMERDETGEEETDVAGVAVMCVGGTEASMLDDGTVVVEFGKMDVFEGETGVVVEVVMVDEEVVEKEVADVVVVGREVR